MHTMRNFKIKVSTVDLIKKLEENKKTHASEYATATEGYVLELKERLEKLTSQVEKDPLSANLRIIGELGKPSNYTNVYDQVISMLKMSVDEETELDSEQFRAWVQNTWEWSDSWRSLNSGYVTKASGLC